MAQRDTAKCGGALRRLPASELKPVNISLAIPLFLPFIVTEKKKCIIRLHPKEFETQITGMYGDDYSVPFLLEEVGWLCPSLKLMPDRSGIYVSPVGSRDSK